MNCPLLRASYCGICARSGHARINCPDKQVMECGTVQYLEQLIPPSVLDTYNIQTRTPLPSHLVVKAKEDWLLEVPDNEKDIRVVLMNHGKSLSTRAKENRVRLERLADELGRKLVYLTATKKTATK